MGVDYGEILCTAVDEIVTARLQGLSYDITKLCTIVDDSQSYQGKYVVSDGTARYEAYTTDNSLQKGNNVLVTIPNGDYKLQKIIKGRVATTDTTPFKYESPLSKMVKVTENIFETEVTESNREEKGLTANSSTTYLEKPIYLVENAKQLSGFTRLGMSADFRSLLNGYDVVSGTYGLKVLIEGDVVEKPGVTTKQIYELNFNSDDMVGNPYQFEIPFSQEKVFDISFINSINRIEVYFYQGNNFINGSGERISPYFYSGISEMNESVSNNLFVDNVQLFLGYDVNEFKGETLMIHTDDLLSYQYSRDNNEKNMFLRWIHFKDGESPTIVPANGVGGITDKEVRWYRYVAGTENGDAYGGKNWEKIPSDDIYGQLKCVFTPDVTKQTEQIKAVGIITEQTDIAKSPKEQIYYSNLLVFENEEKVPDQTTKDAAMGLSIECLDGSEGNYFVYNQNGKINNEGLGQGYERKFKAMFNGAEITSDIGTLDWIKWYIPAEGRNKISMIIMNEQQRKENKGDVADESVQYRNNAYWVITRNPKEDKKVFTSNEQSYSISSQWTRQKNNNFIICKVSIDGVEYEATKQLNFGKAGTNGTNLTLVMEFVDNQNALIINDDQNEKDSNNELINNTINVNTYLYSDSDGQIQPITDTNSVEYSWYKITVDENNKDKGYITLLPREKSLDENGQETTQYKDIEVTLQCNIKEIPIDNYYILQAKYNNLTAYLPIPLKTKDTSFIEGAREIIYDHQGIPSYYTGRYRLHYFNGESYQKYEDQHNSEENHSTDWKCNCEIESTSDNISASYHPSLKEISPIDGWGLSAPLFFAENFENKVCISIDVTENNLKLGWSQPILMMQSKYDFAMLNDWDGSLTLNEENGTILSTMLGAGRKNSDNTFSGVLIGDVKSGTGYDKTYEATGVYGIHKGQLSYGFRDDGTGFIGKAGQGQILLDGNKSEIKSANYDLGKDGTLFDLDDGKLNLRFGKGGITLQAKKAPYLLVKNSIGKTLINIGVSGDNQENYIQSDTTSTKNLNNYNDSQASVKLDLAEGSLDIKSSNMQFLVDSTPSDDASPYLKLGVPKGEKDQLYSNDLLYVSKNDYYLQSKTYSSTIPKEYEIKENGKAVRGQCYKYLGKNEEGYTYTKVDEASATLFVKDTYFVFTQANIYFLGAEITEGPLTEEKNKITVNAGTRTEYSTGEDGAAAKPELVDVPVDQVIKEIKTQCSLIYEKSSSGEGFKLDLKNNLIKGYNLYLSGINSSDKINKFFILDSSADEYPFIIGTNLKIKWDGSIEASDITCYNLTVRGDSNIGGNTKINLGQFQVNGQNGGAGYYGGNAKGVAGFKAQSLSNLNVTVLAEN